MAASASSDSLNAGTPQVPEPPRRNAGGDSGRTEASGRGG